MRKGFTLIELLVVIAIVGFLTTISVATIVSAKQKRQTKAVAEQVKNVIMEAHSYAISPKASTNAGSVDIVIAANSIKARVGSVDIVNPVTISSNVTLSCNPAATPCISFENSNSNKIGQVITVRDIVAKKNGINEQYTIKVSPLSGNVTITTP